MPKAFLLLAVPALQSGASASGEPLWSTVQLVDGTEFPVLNAWKRFAFPGRGSLVSVVIERRDLEPLNRQHEQPLVRRLKGSVVARVVKVHAGDQALLSRHATMRKIRGGLKSASDSPFQSSCIPMLSARGIWFVIEHKGDLCGLSCVVSQARLPAYDQVEFKSSEIYGVSNYNAINEFVSTATAYKHGELEAQSLASLIYSRNKCIAQWAANLAARGQTGLSRKSLQAWLVDDNADSLARSLVDDTLVSRPSIVPDWRTHRTRVEMYQGWMKSSGDEFRDIMSLYIKPSLEAWGARGFDRERLDAIVTVALDYHERQSKEWEALRHTFPNVMPPGVTIEIPAD